MIFGDDKVVFGKWNFEVNLIKLILLFELLFIYVIFC